MLNDREDLVDAYSEKLLRYAVSILCNHQDAEDVVQDVFLAAAQAAFDGANTSAWLHKITYNKSMNLIKRRRFYVFGGIAKDVAAQPMQTDLQMDVLQALRRIAPADRALIYGRIWLGYSFDELAAQMGARAAALRKRFERAKKHCPHCLRYTARRIWEVKNEHKQTR